MTKPNFFNVLILFLSVYILGALLIGVIVDLPPETQKLLQIFDFAICIVFFLDFCVQFYQAESKLKFMRWGWVDLVASIPMIDIFRIGRLLRFVRILRVVKAFKSLKDFLDSYFENKAQGTLNSAIIVAVLMIIFCSITILQVERTPESNITTAGDALWWAFVTITTVGYGDHYPVTLEGRLIAAVLMTTGVGLFGTFTAYVASWFVKG
ncbi:ion transporter [Algoriphagus aquimarinus]|uniref:Ion transporter n=1 Tax=Algoriphagus aquimarinus TaxID=237018 RepID=A0A5C7AYA1_9BACT|nr:ion transporter [Algoriphagus aquimarinus]TXE13648.1 ion transporter [Algoriphagus aquimarinus]